MWLFSSLIFLLTNLRAHKWPVFSRFFLSFSLFHHLSRFIWCIWKFESFKLFLQHPGKHFRRVINARWGFMKEMPFICEIFLAKLSPLTYWSWFIVKYVDVESLCIFLPVLWMALKPFLWTEESDLNTINIRLDDEVRAWGSLLPQNSPKLAFSVDEPS